jgi:polysaccharide biosynthesis transport protein
MNNSSPLLSEESAEGSPVDIRALIDGLVRRWRLIAAIPLICFLVTLTGLQLVPSSYLASSQLLIFDPQWRTEVPVGEQRSPSVNFDTVAINTEIEVLKSAALALRVARELRLDQYPEFQQHSRVAGLVDQLGLSGAVVRLRELLEPHSFGEAEPAADHLAVAPDPAKVEDERIDIAAAILRERLQVDRLPFSYVLVVSVISGAPDMAQRLVAAVVDDYLADQRETRQTALQQMSLWLKERLFELKSRVVETETAIEKLKAQSGLSDTGKGSINEQQITDLNAQLMLARAEVAEKRARLEHAREPPDGNGGLQNLAEGGTSPLMAQLRLQQSELVRREAELRAKLGNRHAEVLALEAQLAGLNKAMNDEAAQGIADVQYSLDVAVRREQSLEAGLQQLTAKQSNSGDYVKLQQLQRVAGADSKLYETYLAQYNEVASETSLQAVGPRIISPAGLPSAPSFPRHKLLLCLGATVFGLAIGVLLAILVEYVKGSVQTGVQAEKMFRYPVLGGLPFVSQNRPSSDRADDQLVQTIMTAPLSTFSEAIRAIRISLRLSEHRNAPSVILVTSCLPGEGKSTLAMLLAASSAAANHRTMLVDCDLRGRTISQRVRRQAPGLAELLSGSADIATVTVRDVASGCFVIPAGAPSDSPGDLLASKRMDEIIRQLRADFDYIVLDTPPLLPVVDTLTLLPVADKILLTVDSTRASYDNIAAAFRYLRPEADRIAGMVFNKLSQKQLARYRYGAYYDRVSVVEAAAR